MINRRNLIGMILGGGAAAAVDPTMTVSKAAAALGLPADPDMSDLVEKGQDIILTPGRHFEPWEITNLYRVSMLSKTRPAGEMPAHIATKLSWSPSYKASVWQKEMMIIELLDMKMRRDQAFAERVFAVMTGARHADPD